MTVKYYQEFFALTKIKLGIIREIRGVIAESMLHIESSTMGSHDLKLIRPRLLSEKPTGLRDFFDGLNISQVDSLKVFGDQCQVDKTNARVRWRIEVWQNDGGINGIYCEEIHGLPRQDEKCQK
jgi:hypothetical protein